MAVFEYVMAVEEAFNVELDENEVNACGHLVQLVKTASKWPQKPPVGPFLGQPLGNRSSRQPSLRPANPARRR